MSKLAELGILTCEQSADETTWRIDWPPEFTTATLSFISVPPLRPLRGLLYSLGLHICVVALAGYFHWWPFFNHKAPQLTPDQMEALEYEPLVLNLLPALSA